MEAHTVAELVHMCDSVGLSYPTLPTDSTPVLVPLARFIKWISISPYASSVSRITRPAADFAACIYRYYGEPIDLETVIKETAKLPGPGGGTLMVHLAVHALSRGYEVDTWVCNTRHMDRPGFSSRPTCWRS